MARGIGEVVVRILGDASNFKKAVGDVDASADRLQSRFSKVAAATTSILGGIGIAALAQDATRAAAEEEQQMATLASTLRKTAGARADDIAAVEKWITATQNATGVSDGELRPALAKLLISGRSVTQAQKDMAVAMDIAAARGLSLESVTQAMARASQGNLQALGRLGIATKNAAGETLTYDQILKAASQTMGGAAAAAADTAAGRAAILRARFADLQENIGMALIPILEKLTTVLSSVATWFNNLSPGMQKVVMISGALLIALGPLMGLITSLTAVVTGLGAAMAFLAANPIVLVIAAIAALIAGVYLAYQRFEGFRRVVDTIIGVFRQNWGAILAPLTGGLSLLVQHFDKVVGFAKTLIDWLKKIPGAVDRALGPIDELVGKSAGLLGKGMGLLGKIPGFDSGGVVGGRRGSAQLALVHGGETILPTHKTPLAGSKVELHIHGVEGAGFEANADYAARTLGWRLGLSGGL